MSQHQNKYSKNLQENPQLTLHNQLNTSSSKMQYPFPQSRRFNYLSQISSSPNKYYQLPSLWTMKGASIGKSNRGDLNKNEHTPSPNLYKINSYFNSSRKTCGITMGLGRELIKYRNMFEGQLIKSPGSATYYPEPSYHSRSFSIGQKLQNFQNKWVEQVPGPGKYPASDLTSKNNYKPISKYISTPTSVFGKQKRSNIQLNTISPGPGKYEQKSECFDQKNKQKRHFCKFGKGQRQYSHDNKKHTPGPGSYKTFSQFLK